MRDLTPPRSSPVRDRLLDSLAARTWDVLVVGGGITGSAVARDAALRGLDTALVEQADIAFGTSSRSSRLIHGGLRYLKNFDFALVREGLVERHRLLRAAPGLVRAVDFLYPVYHGDPDPLWKVNLGVGLYEMLSFGYGLGGKRLLSSQAVEQAVPGVLTDALRGGVRYRDAATHDTRLTLAVAISARAAGATVVSRCPATQLLQDSGAVTGAEVEDRISGERTPVRARSVILACGPWQKLYATTPIRLRTARGTHLSVRQERLPLACFIALRSPDDGRLAFAMPIGRYTVIGTTDQHDPTAPADVRPTPADTEYLLRLANHSFPGAQLDASDIAGAWAGLRPLIEEDPEEHADEISREHRVAAGPPGLWVLAGGKLTTHRRMAEDCLDQVVPYLRRLGRAPGECRTALEPLFPASLDSDRRLLADRGLDGAAIEDLAQLYGDRLDRLLTTLPARARPTPETLLDAQIDLAVDEELALTLGDVLMRRAGPGALDLRACHDLAPTAASRMAERLAWTEGEEREQVELLRAGIRKDLEAAGVPPP